MIIGYDLACYSYGSGPCVTPSMGYLDLPAFDEAARRAAATEILRTALHANPGHPRVTSVIVQFRWGDGERTELRAELIDRDTPERAPFPYQADAMAAFRANVRVDAR